MKSKENVRINKRCQICEMNFKKNCKFQLKQHNVSNQISEIKVSFFLTVLQKEPLWTVRVEAGVGDRLGL